MPTQPSPIQWRSRDEEKLNRTIRNFNAKLSRLIKKDPALKDVLPEKLSKQALKKNLETRKDFNNFIKSAQRFSTKGTERVIANDYGVKITAWEKRELQYKLNAINARRRQERKIAEMTEVMDRGKAQGYKTVQMGTTRFNALLPKSFHFEKMRRADFQSFVRVVTKQAAASFPWKQKEQYKENYLKAMRGALSSEYQYLIDHVAKLPPEVLLKAFYGDPKAGIDFYYTPMEERARAYVLEGVFGLPPTISEESLQWEELEDEIEIAPWVEKS